MEVIEQGGMVGGFDAHDVVGAVCLEFAAHRLFGIQVVAEVDGLEHGIALGMVVQPSIGGFDFAILFAVAILRDDEFRSQW